MGVSNRKNLKSKTCSVFVHSTSCHHDRDEDVNCINHLLEMGKPRNDSVSYNVEPCKRWGS